MAVDSNILLRGRVSRPGGRRRCGYGWARTGAWVHRRAHSLRRPSALGLMAVELRRSRRDHVVAGSCGFRAVLVRLDTPFSLLLVRIGHEARKLRYRDPSWVAEAETALCQGPHPPLWQLLLVDECGSRPGSVGRSDEQLVLEAGVSPLALVCQLALEEDLSTMSPPESPMRKVMTWRGLWRNRRWHSACRTLVRTRTRSSTAASLHPLVGDTVRQRQTRRRTSGAQAQWRTRRHLSARRSRLSAPGSACGYRGIRIRARWPQGGATCHGPLGGRRSARRRRSSRCIHVLMNTEAIRLDRRRVDLDRVKLPGVVLGGGHG